MMKHLIVAASLLVFLIAQAFGQGGMGPGPGTPALIGPPSPTIDGTTTITSASTPWAVTLTTTQTNDIIEVFFKTNGSTVSSIVSVPTLTWTARVGGSNNAFEYYAKSAAAQTSITITVTLSFGNAQGLAFGVSGANFTTPFDTNASLPATGTTSATYSTSNASDIALCFANDSTTATPSPPTGFNNITPPLTNTSMSYRTLSTTQSSVTISPPGSPQTVIVDAIQQ